MQEGLTMTTKEALESAIALPLSEAAPLLRTTAKSLRFSVKAGTIPGIRVGGRWMIPTSYLREIAASAEPSAETKP